jgi:hypothetical protein
MSGRIPFNEEKEVSRSNYHTFEFTTSSYCDFGVFDNEIWIFSYRFLDV